MQHDGLALVREALDRQRRDRVPFVEAWPAALAGLEHLPTSTPTERSDLASTRNALESTTVVWRAAYEDKPAPPAPYSANANERRAREMMARLHTPVAA